MRRTLAGLAAALALCACSRPAPQPGAQPGDASRVAAIEERASATPSTAPLPAPSAAPVPDDPSEAASNAPVVALAPPVRLDPAAVVPAPTAAAPPSAAPTGAPGKPAAAPPVEDSFAPRDECAPLPGWKPFRDKLTAAVAKRDAAALTKLADPTVKLDYGGGEGTRELRRRLAQPGDRLWRDLATVVPLGCSVEAGIAAVPWFFWRIPPKVDPTTTMLVTGTAVALRAAPRPNARVVTTLDWPMVTLAGNGFDAARRFTHVRTRAGGQDGYVETHRLRNLLARRLIAERKADEWRISAIVEGD